MDIQNRLMLESDGDIAEKVVSRRSRGLFFVESFVGALKLHLACHVGVW